MITYKAKIWVIDANNKVYPLSGCTVAENTREAINKIKDFLTNGGDRVLQITIWEER